ncbi:MAG: hypothetical protein ACWA6X_03040 [Bauldia sp.]
MRALRLFAVGAALALAAPQVVHAQAPVAATPEVQNFIYKGKWGFRLPEGWQVNAELSFPYIASSPAAAATMEQGLRIQPGDVAIGIFPQDLMPALGITYTASSGELAAALAAWLGGEIDLVPLEGAAGPAVWTSLAGSLAVAENSHLVVYESGGAAFAMLVVTLDFAGTAADIVRGIIASTVVLGAIP